MSDPHTGYSCKFREASTAARYQAFYNVGTTDYAIWTHEQELLADLLARRRADWPACDYLDFACGAGRIIEFMESRVSTSRGIDISPEMLRLAGPKLRRRELICADITTSEAPARTYDPLRVFRFFLIASPPLRPR